MRYRAATVRERSRQPFEHPSLTVGVRISVILTGETLSKRKVPSVPTHLSRRGFIKAGATLTTVFGFDLRPAVAQVRELKISRTTQTHSICPYCAVGCSVVIHTLGDKAKNVRPTVVHIEGDPDSPINRGTLCPKGISLKQFVVNDQRLTRPLYRAPGATEWKTLSWEEAFDRMARLIKETRDKGFEVNDSEGRRVNRLNNVALIGGSTDTNEINFLLGKFRLGLGILAYENQARL
ncbi:MAG: molybdopterin oxidoreductase [Acidobacteria bacterium]|nr:MAG: molybdopterin oxidoreductase [Acidobacteriota bacterium]